MLGVGGHIERAVMLYLLSLSVKTQGPSYYVVISEISLENVGISRGWIHRDALKNPYSNQCRNQYSIWWSRIIFTWRVPLALINCNCWNHYWIWRFLTIWRCSPSHSTSKRNNMDINNRSMLRHSWLKNSHEGSPDGVVRRSHARQRGLYRKFLCRYTARYRQLAMLSFIWPARNDSRYALNKLMIIQLSYNSQINWLYPKWFSFWCNLHQIHVAVVQKSTWPFFGVIYTKKLTTERPVQSNALLRAHLVIADISRVLFFLYLLRWKLFLLWASKEIILPGKIPSQVLTKKPWMECDER